MRQQLPVGVGPAATDFSDLCLSQMGSMHVLDIVEQCTCGGILLGFGQLLDLT